jgi:16S rRNA (adenine1518-N6/adenine1519-N6)-dimethyltransferase
MSEQNDPELTQAPARKALGQHFLFDPSILHRAATAAGPLEGRTVIEVGPGPGGLTRAILKEGAAKLIAVETDPRFASALQEWPEARDGRLTVIEKDARKVKWEQVLTDAGADTPAMIIANLPYNVGTVLLIDWLKAGAWRGEMALMFQKEVAQRICADPGTEHYGRLAVLTHAVTRPHIAFTLPPGAFKPPPKVDSAVAVLEPLPESVEPVRVHHLGPGGDEVLDELLLVVVLGIDLGIGRRIEFEPNTRSALVAVHLTAPLLRSRIS